MNESDRKKLDEIADDLMGSIFIFSRRVSRERHHLGRGKFDPSRFVLRHVHEFGPIRMSEIGRHMEVSKPYMTALVDKLIDEGLVERITDPDDRRVVIIRITPAGRDAVRDFRKAAREALVRRLSSLSSQDIASLNESMKNIRSVLARLDTDSAETQAHEGS